MAVPWDLVADIGGTNARFGVIQGEENKIIKEFNHSVLEYPKFSQVISTLLTQVGTS